MTIGEKIALRRRSAGLSQEALAGQLGVSRQAVSRWETNESLPDTEKILQLCRIFGVSADDLLLDKAPETACSRPPLPLWRRWLRYIYLGLGAAGAVLALVGTVGALLWSATTSEWYTDWGRFGTALWFNWPGPVLLGGVVLLLLALALLAFDVLLSKRDCPVSKM
ncbi:helix-turn-helix transcriptional regulator [Dysosmobacter sp.]|uniref:helix-turn-helix transcriptional regulator n=1 Tax=Dysosmobacter sp. TaxID=2591382 RepID=UPI003A8EAB1E